MISLRMKTFVHGNAVFLQFPGGAGLEFTGGSRMDQVAHHAWTDIVGERQGPGVLFRGNTGNRNFFHVSIPSPNILPIFNPKTTPDNTSSGGSPAHNYFAAQLELINVFFNVTVDNGVRITQVFAFDGRDVIAGFPRPPGRLPVPPAATLLIVNPSHVITAGLGLSFDVTFDSPGNIAFHAAGAEFQMNGLP